jgi:hypothetical protein
MPRYSRNKNKKLVRKHKTFQHPYQILHFLSIASEEDMKPFRDIATSYIKGEARPKVPLKRRALQRIALQSPRKLMKHTVKDFQGNDALGGGVGSALGAIGQVASNMLGIPQLHDAIFGSPKPKAQSLDSEFMAYLVDQAYLPIDQRPDTVLKRFERMPLYDTDHCAVWKDVITGEMTVSVRGTTMNWADISSDLAILAGSIKTESTELDNVLDLLEKNYPDSNFNIAAHSLGTMIVANEQGEHGGNFNNVYLFNPASSAAQPDKYEAEMANMPGYQYFINHGDLVSANMVQFMNQHTLETQVTVGDYQWSPVSAHSLSNWFPEGFEKQDGVSTQVTKLDNQDTNYDVAELQIDTPETQAANLS